MCVGGVNKKIMTIYFRNSNVESMGLKRGQYYNLGQN